ncbi:Ivy family c-type lysozyme inhibitor [Enterovirga aerilata]|uniref:Inhibitor of vertebrate lysozyme (Ivy) n=1 Tax=Enterovirga aerilata TaxID=2730920 RepID=A0A849I9K3_9HYPH|nr:Ivy family c-type lysozyme inhibitor [Enterovirga sp. DB1703]NNM72760.1 hypothetical protein [Enterovirga sp. DB1703]
MRRADFLLLSLCLAAPVPAAEIETAHTLHARRPQAFAAYQAVLPKGFEADPWIRILDGVSEPVQIVQRSGKAYVIGFSCKPHDCGQNALAFMAALDGSRAVVVVKSDERTEGRVEVYGRSTAEERRLLKEILSIPR